MLARQFRLNRGRSSSPPQATEPACKSKSGTTDRVSRQQFGSPSFNLSSAMEKRMGADSDSLLQRKLSRIMAGRSTSMELARPAHYSRLRSRSPLLRDFPRTSLQVQSTRRGPAKMARSVH